MNADNLEVAEDTVKAGANTSFFALIKPCSGVFLPNHANVPRTINTLSKIEINDAAITVLKTFSATIPADRAACITTNESSPICVSPAATRIAVLSG